jgi:hypothetical protein
MVPGPNGSAATANYIQIEHGGDLETRYAHLSGYAVVAGQMVHKGDLIGYVGTTGRSTGPHLHYEVRVAGEAVDPRPYMMNTQLAVAILRSARAASRKRPKDLNERAPGNRRLFCMRATARAAARRCGRTSAPTSSRSSASASVASMKPVLLPQS